MGREEDPRVAEGEGTGPPGLGLWLDRDWEGDWVGDGLGVWEGELIGVGEAYVCLPQVSEPAPPRAQLPARVTKPPLVTGSSTVSHCWVIKRRGLGAGRGGGCLPAL